MIETKAYKHLLARLCRRDRHREQLESGRGLSRIDKEVRNAGGWNGAGELRERIREEVRRFARALSGRSRGPRRPG